MDDQIVDRDAGYSTACFAANSVIFNEGDPGDAAYVIRSGTVEIRKGMRGDHPLRLAELREGDVLGELALFDDRPRMAAAVAMTDVETIRMPRKAFLEKVAGMDPGMRGIVLTMVGRVRTMADEFMRRKTDVEWAKWKMT